LHVVIIFILFIICILILVFNGLFCCNCFRKWYLFREIIPVVIIRCKKFCNPQRKQFLVYKDVDVLDTDEIIKKEEKLHCNPIDVRKTTKFVETEFNEYKNKIEELESNIETQTDNKIKNYKNNEVRNEENLKLLKKMHKEYEIKSKNNINTEQEKYMDKSKNIKKDIFFSNISNKRFMKVMNSQNKDYKKLDSFNKSKDIRNSKNEKLNENIDQMQNHLKTKQTKINFNDYCVVVEEEKQNNNDDKI